jgi:spore maturation protein CgeB
MKIVVFGLTISSSWGNGHATLWRGLCAALARLGHRVVFFERDAPYYASNRDLWEIPGGALVLYEAWETIRRRARAELHDADVAIATSYCPDAIAATSLLLDAPRAVSVFYDLDTPVTLAQLASGEPVSYLGPRGLADFDVVLSYTGAGALDALRDRLGAKLVVPLYGHVDPTVHRPAEPAQQYRADLSYLGTYAADRQRALETLFVAPARARPNRRFLIGGALYPKDFPWTSNIFFVRHMPPGEHPRFFSSSRLTLNVTRRAMAEMGWCPSGRLFEAAACGTAILSDDWPGLDAFFELGQEILVARTTEDAVAALDVADAEIRRIAAAGRERVLAEHTSLHRAHQLVAAIEAARSRAPVPAMEA